MTEITSLNNEPTHLDNENAVISYQYPYYIAIDISYFIIIPVVEDARKRLAELQSQ